MGVAHQLLKETQQSSEREKMKELEELQVRALGDNGFLFGSTC